MESIRVTPEGSRRADGAIADEANVQDELATLFKRFRLDLEQMFGRSPGKTVLVTKSRI